MSRPKKISMQDIADRLGISKNAVSLALAGKKGVGEQLKAQVRRMAEELGYPLPQEAAAADGAAEAARSAVLVLVPERVMSYEDNEHFLFYHDLIWGLEEKLRARGFSAVILRIGSEMELSLKLPELAETMACRGVILFGIVSEAYAQMVCGRFPAALLFDSFHRSVNAPAVTSANVEGAAAAARYLLACGHRRIGFIGPANLTSSHEERWFGYWLAMQQAKADILPQWLLLESAGFASSPAEIEAFADRLQVAPPALRPTALLCGNDRLALLLLDALERRGLRVPADLSLMGFDGLPQAAAAQPPLATMKVDKLGLCDAVVEWLLLPERQQPAGRARLHWTVPASLHPGGSVAKLEDGSLL
ncbi:LacI family DNA-binding transcriptional regulator [Paenibacillus athensensis]|uniref:HTH lacI-type domain-containing protein n=1 Tax=Paenibacillus athensensis TaxID=1967502 RepID=A0A4Y8Q0N5_9BACL|nr:LacI family DNA-binding transcriptional regulator [Paenibacillus athensensis]MCD1259654.1 LacI family DNA-binding transcriptional regulator [Paenibacillus athensensis]